MSAPGWHAAVSGRYGSGLTENLVIGRAGRAFLRHGRGWAFVAEASAEVSRRLDPEFQIVLGGDTGLRGYPVRYARGDRRWLVTLEERWYAELLKLFHIGAAIFVDLGRAWFESGEPDIRDVQIVVRGRDRF